VTGSALRALPATSPATGLHGYSLTPALEWAVTRFTLSGDYLDKTLIRPRKDVPGFVPGPKDWQNLAHFSEADYERLSFPRQLRDLLDKAAADKTAPAAAPSLPSQAPVPITPPPNTTPRAAAPAPPTATPAAAPPTPPAGPQPRPKRHLVLRRGAAGSTSPGYPQGKLRVVLPSVPPAPPQP
jgi:hypothetical protein